MWCCRKADSAAEVAAKGLEKELLGNHASLQSANEMTSSLQGWQKLTSRIASILAAVLFAGIALLTYKFGVRQVLFHPKVHFASGCCAACIAALLVVSFALSWRMNKLTERSVKLREARHQLLHRCANELPLKAARELLGRYAPDGGNAYLSINPNMEKQMVDLRDGCRELLRIVDHLVCVRGSEVPREQLEAELGPVAALVKKYAQHLSPAAQELLTAGMGERILGLMGATPTAAKAGSATPRGGGQRNARTPHAGAATPRAAPNSTVLHTIHDDDAAEAASPGEEALLTAQPPSSGRVRRRLHTDDKDATEPSTGGDDVVVSNGASDSDGAAEESGNHTKAA